MLPIAFTMMIASPLSAKLVEKFGKRKVVATGMLLVATGMFLVSLVGVTTPYIWLALSMVVMAAGMAVAMSPTTDLLMSAVPRNRAGMGSAMNDTTRELGASLGIAVLGSLLASQYTSKIAPTVSALPSAAREVAEQSLAGAMAVGRQIGGPAGLAVVKGAKESFMSGLSFSLVVGAAIVAVAAVVAFVGLPDKAHDHSTQA
jgi:predicted MFS family arabinose efflux permease